MIAGRFARMRSVLGLKLPSRAPTGAKVFPPSIDLVSSQPGFSRTRYRPGASETATSA
jgi:hypothetical protein